MGTGAWVLVAAVVACVLFGGLRLLTDGRFRGTHRVRGAEQPPEAVPDESPWAGQLGERATLVQFSSAFCAPCRTTRTVLAEVARTEPGVAHVEVDAEHHLDVVRRLGILRTPTTLVLDAAGHEVARAGGVPTRDQVRRALAALG